MTTTNCSCGEKGYEGIFRMVLWTCPKCGKVNKYITPKSKKPKPIVKEAVAHPSG